MREGYVPIFRKLKNHWLYNDNERLSAWIKILLEVNYKTQKVFIDSEMFVCSAGESLNSLETWSRIFGPRWNKSKVRRFFQLLKEDEMILLTNERKTTRLTVCNFESYNNTRNADETQMKRKTTQESTQESTQEPTQSSHCIETSCDNTRNANETASETQMKRKTTPKEEDKKEYNNNNNARVYRKFKHLQITFGEVTRLTGKGFSLPEIDEILNRVQNYRQNTKYDSLYLTALNWLNSDKSKKEKKQKNSEISDATSGVNVSEIDSQR